MKWIKRIFKYLLITIVCFELALWVLGYRPYKYIHFKVKSEPSHAVTGDSLLGFRLNPGTYQVTLQDSLTFSAQHTANGRRFIPGHPEPGLEKGQIHFLGCSYTYGYGVNDEESFPALTQDHFKHLRILNHAVMGYGTSQSLLQIQEAREIRQNDLVVLCFSAEHFKRNVLSNAYRLHLKIGFENTEAAVKNYMKGARFPYVTAPDSAMRFEPWKEIYAHWSLREYSPGINLIQSQFELFQDRQVDEVAVTAYLMEEIAKEVTARQGRFLVVCLDTNENTKKLQNSVNFPYWLNLNFNFSNQDLTNYPYDSHPNAAGHIDIAEQLIPHLSALIDE